MNRGEACFLGNSLSCGVHMVWCYYVFPLRSLIRRGGVYDKRFQFATHLYRLFLELSSRKVTPRLDEAAEITSPSGVLMTGQTRTVCTIETSFLICHTYDMCRTQREQEVPHCRLASLLVPSASGVVST
jgi:hypothetical protein